MSIVVVRQRMQMLSKMIKCKTFVGGFSSPLSNPKVELWIGGGNY